MACERCEKIRARIAAVQKGLGEFANHLVNAQPGDRNNISKLKEIRNQMRQSQIEVVDKPK